MAQTLVIEVEFEDDSDFDFALRRMIGAVEDIADELGPENDDRFDGKVEVSWDVKDGS